MIDLLMSLLLIATSAIRVLHSRCWLRSWARRKGGKMIDLLMKFLIAMSAVRILHSKRWLQVVGNSHKGGDVIKAGHRIIDRDALHNIGD
jgi:hypothetical protein